MQTARSRTCWTYARDGGPPSGIRIVPSSDLLAVRARSQVELWDATTGELTRNLHISTVGSAPWDVLPNGEGLVASVLDGLTILDWSGDELLRLVQSREVRRYLAGEAPALCRVRGVSYPNGMSDEIIEPEEPYRYATSVSLSADGRCVAAAFGQAYALVWSLVDGSLLGCVGEEDGRGRPRCVHRVSLSACGRLLLAVYDAGEAVVWDLESGRDLHRFRLNARVDLDRPSTRSEFGGLSAAAFSPASDRVVVCDGTTLRTWDATSGRALGEWVASGDEHPFFGSYDGQPRIHDARFSADGRRILTVGVDAALRVWDVETGIELWSDIPDPCCMDWADIAADGRSVAWVGCTGMRLYLVG